MTIGVGMTKHQFLPGQGIEINYVDPANVVYSYTEDPYFKDCFYWGELKTIPMAELVKINPDITNEEMEEIAKYSQSWYNYYNNAQYYENSLFYRDTCTLLYFNYNSHKKESNTYMINSEDDTFRNKSFNSRRISFSVPRVF